MESDGLRSNLIPAVRPIQVDSFPYSTFLRRPAKEELLEEEWDVFSIPGRICRNPLLSNALLEMWKKVEHPLILYLWGWQARMELWAQDQLGHSIPTPPVSTSCKLNYLPLFSLQSLLDRWPQLPAKLHCWNREPPTGWGLFAGNQHIFLRVLPSKPLQTDKICSVKEIFFGLHPLSNRGFNPEERFPLGCFCFCEDMHKFTWKRSVWKMHIAKPETINFWCSFRPPFVHLDIVLSDKYAIGNLRMDVCSPSLNRSVSFLEASLRWALRAEASKMISLRYASLRRVWKGCEIA